MQTSRWADVPTSLTATAPAFEPSQYAQQLQPQPAEHLAVEDATDGFASTRPPDDLFDDEFTPISEAMVPANISPKNRGRGGQARGRGRVRDTVPTSEVQSRETADNSTKPASPPVDAPEGPKRDAVRGDRSGTGGLKKASLTKLTEEELSARMEAMKLKNASLLAAHARAEADETSFQEREAQAEHRRRQDRQNRQQMMGEREKNRMRKLQGAGGREWDAEKEEEDYTGRNGRGSQFRRGAFGGIAYGGRADVHGNEEEGLDEANGTTRTDYGQRADDHGRGRGSGRGRGRGRGRGPFEGSTQQRQQRLPEQSDFPALPTPTKSTPNRDSKPPTSQTQPDRHTNNGVESMDIPNSMAAQSWADQVESADS